MPSALRMRKSTTEILRKPVIVTTNSGMSAAIVTKMMMVTMLKLLSGIVGEPRNPHAEAVADPHQHAAPDAPAVCDDVERVIDGACQRHERSRREFGDLAE